jgi:hypothetical protein
MSNSRNRNRNRNRSNTTPPPGDSHVDRVMPFRFKHEGKTFVIPPASEAVRNVKAGGFIDAVRSDEMGQMRYFVSLLDAAEPSAEAMDALRDMDLQRFANVMQQWVERTGAHPGKSGPSSD